MNAHFLVSIYEFCMTIIYLMATLIFLKTVFQTFFDACFISSFVFLIENLFWSIFLKYVKVACYLHNVTLSTQLFKNAQKIFFLIALFRISWVLKDYSMVFDLITGINDNFS